MTVKKYILENVRGLHDLPPPTVPTHSHNTPHRRHIEPRLTPQQTATTNVQAQHSRVSSCLGSLALGLHGCSHLKRIEPCRLRHLDFAAHHKRHCETPADLLALDTSYNSQYLTTHSTRQTGAMTHHAKHDACLHVYNAWGFSDPICRR